MNKFDLNQGVNKKASPATCCFRFCVGLVLILFSCTQVLAQGQPSGVYGSLLPGETRENVLAAAPSEALTYHTYTVAVPAGSGSLTISIDGMGNDIDLALKYGSEISAYDEAGDYDYLDFSEEPNPSFSLINPAAGIFYIDIVNVIDRAAAYRLSVNVEKPVPAEAASDDGFVGTFIGQDIRLTLRSESAGYQGELDVQGQRYSVMAQAEGNRLVGSFFAGQDFAFEATLTGDQLSLSSGGSSYQLSRQTSSQAKQATPNQDLTAADQSTPQALTGKWTRQDDYGFGQVIDYSLYFLPDGRYFHVISGDVPTQEEGRYEVSADQISFSPFCDAVSSATFQLAEQLTLSSLDALGDTVTSTYQLEPGSAASVLQEVAAADAERAAFHAQTPTGLIQAGQQRVDPSLPVDPSPEKIFPQAMVFSEGEHYSYFSSNSYVMDRFGQLQTVTITDLTLNTEKMATLDYSRGEYRDQAFWYFAPHGRAFVKYETYWNAVDLSSNPITPSIVSSWGRYRIEDDSILVETSEGEQLTLTLILGRRKLSQGSLCFEEIEWATEQLEEGARRIQDGN